MSFSSNIKNTMGNVHLYQCIILHIMSLYFELFTLLFTSGNCRREFPVLNFFMDDNTANFPVLFDKLNYFEIILSDTK